MKTVLLAILAAAVSQTAFAGNDLLGSWRFVKTECSSGAVIEAKPDSLEWSNFLLYTFTPTELLTESHVSYKLDPAKAEKLLQANQGMKEFWTNMPGSISRTESLKKIEQSIQQIQTLAQGRQCDREVSQTYSLKGDVLKAGRSIVKVSNCSDMTSENTQQSSKPVVTQVLDNKLKMSFETEAPAGNGTSCPTGDKTIWVFVRAASGLG